MNRKAIVIAFIAGCVGGVLLGLPSAFGQSEKPASSGGGSDACTGLACSVASLTSSGAVSGTSATFTTGNFTGAVAGQDAGFVDVTARNIYPTGNLFGQDAGFVDVTARNVYPTGNLFGQDAGFVDVTARNVYPTGNLFGQDAGFFNSTHTGPILSTVASGSNGFQCVTSGCRVSLSSTDANAYIWTTSNLVVFNESAQAQGNITANGGDLSTDGTHGYRNSSAGARLLGTPTNDGSAVLAKIGATSGTYSTAGATIVNFYNDGATTVKASIDVGGSLFQASTTLRTCVAGIEGMESIDATAGVSTGHRTRRCMCTSDGAAAYAWQNVVSATVGTSTTCSD